MRHIYNAFFLIFSISPLGISANCWEQAGLKYGIDPLLLKAIAWKESNGDPSAVGIMLPDGNQALGQMQINTIHLPKLRPFGIDREDLFNACVSQYVGAWVLADCIQKFGTTWKAVGCYYTGPHSLNVAAQIDYVSDVHRYYKGYLLQQEYLNTSTSSLAQRKRD
jgi:soluble lytic murein transglycosylase-like protein